MNEPPPRAPSVHAVAPLALAAGLGTACFLVGGARALDGREVLRIGLGGAVIALAAAAAVRLRASAFVVLPCGALAFLVAHLGVQRFFVGAASSAEVIALEAATGVAVASGLVLARVAVGALDDRGAAGRALVAASAWLLVACAACAIPATELVRRVAVGVGVVGGIGLGAGLLAIVLDAGGAAAVRALARAIGAAVAWTGVLGCLAVVAFVAVLGSGLHAMTSPHPCDLDRRFFNTSGTRIEAVETYPLPGASEWRIHVGATFWTAQVVACADGDRYIDSTELFALLAARAPNRDARALAALHDWVTAAGGTSERAILDAPADGGAFTVAPPTVRGGVLEYWSDDTRPHWDQRRYFHVCDLASGGGTRADTDELARATRGEDDDLSVRAAVARLRGDAETLLALHDSARADARDLPLSLLRGLAGPAHTARLLTIAHIATDPVERAAAIGALAAIGDPPSIDAARDLMAHETDPTAAAILGRNPALAPAARSP
jgi:hypothetical protein